MRRAEGVSAADLLAAVTVLSVCIGIGLPALEHLRLSGRAAAGARTMAMLFSRQRWQATAHRNHRGLYFRTDRLGWYWHEVEDGNGNGLRTAEIRSGVDPEIAGPFRLEDMVEGVSLGFLTGGEIPRIPPATGNITGLDDPVKFGRSDIVSFSPIGRSSSGTLYLTDGRTGQFGVVLFGPSTRIRVWRFDGTTGKWVL